MQKETELCGLLIELMTFFNPKIFGEVLYIIHQIWHQKYLPFRNRQKEGNSKVIPKFSCFFGYEGEENHLDPLEIENKDAG